MTPLSNWRGLMRMRTLIFGCVLSVAGIGVAQAHDTWLLPDPFAVPAQSTVTLDLTSGMAFPALETGPKPERVASAQCRLAGQTFRITDIVAGEKSLRLKATLAAAGIATIWVTLPPKSIELKPEQVEEYFAEIDAPAEVRKRWQGTPEPKRWREFYTKNPKTFVRVGAAPENDQSWREPVGQGLEIVPENDPTALHVGDDFPVRVLRRGQPLPEFSLNAVPAGEIKGETRKTDENGRVVFRLTKPGSWLIRGTDLRPATRKDADWESDFATITLYAVAKG